MDKATGATGASPSPSKGASSGSSPTSAQGSTSTPVNMGMGAGQSGGTPSSGKSQSYGPQSPEFWDEHGEGIFQHERFKELTGYKKKYDEVAPISQFVQELGGIDQLKQFNSYLGPVWKALTSNENGSQLWSKLLPVLQAIVNNQDISPFLAQQAREAMADATGSDDSDPMLAKIKPLEEKLNRFEQSQKQREEAEQQKARQDRHMESVNKYTKLLDAKFKDESNKIPESFKEDAAEMIINHIGKYMPKDANGRFLNPLDVFNAEAFENVWNEVVVKRWRKLSQLSLDQAKTSTENGGTALPKDSARGGTPNASQVPPARSDKARRLAQFFQTGS